MKKSNKKLHLDKLTISKLQNLNEIKGGESGGVETQTSPQGSSLPCLLDTK